MNAWKKEFTATNDMIALTVSCELIPERNLPSLLATCETRVILQTWDFFFTLYTMNSNFRFQGNQKFKLISRMLLTIY